MKEIEVGMSGSATRAALNNREKTYSAEEYGAVGDGITNDLTALTNAINAAIADNALLILSGKTFLISSNLTIDISNKKLRIVGSGKTVIKSSGNVVTIHGINGTDDHITQNIVKGEDTVLTSVLYSTVVAGDLLQVVSTDEYANVGVSGHYKGEIVEVLRVSGSTIYLKSKFYDSYNKDTSHIRLLNAGCLSVSGVKFDNTRLALSNLNRSVFSDIDIYNGNIAGLELYYSKNVLIQSARIEKSNIALSGWHYGINTAGCQNVTIRDCFVSNYEQGIIAGGAYPVRDYTVAYNRVQNENTANNAQIDTHTNCEYVNIVGNTVTNGGIYCKGKNVTIQENKVDGKIEIYREDLTNDLVHELHLTEYMNIKNNACSAIWVGLATFRDIIPVINIIGNVVNSVDAYAFLYYSDFAPNCVIKELNIENNYFSTVTADATHYGIYVANGDGTIENFNFKRNIVKSTDFHPFYITSGTTINQAVFDSNSFRTSGLLKNVNVNNATKTFFVNNIFDTTPLLITNTHAIIRNNVFKNFISSDNAIVQGLTTDESNSIISSGNDFGAITTRPVYINHPTTAFIDEVKYLSGSLTDTAPTAAEINVICGSTPAELGRGFRLIIKDTSGSGLVYEIISNGTSWCYKVLTVAS